MHIFWSMQIILCIYNLQAKSSYQIQVQKIFTAKFDIFMTFFSTLVWKMEAHILKILQGMKVDILSVAFCMCIQSWK